MFWQQSCLLSKNLLKAASVIIVLQPGAKCRWQRDSEKFFGGIYMPLMTRPVERTGSAVPALSVYMRHVYQWMTAGLAITAVVAYMVSAMPQFRAMILGNTISVILLVIAQFGLVIALSAAIHKMSSAMATGMFVLYSALTGVMLSSIFIRYSMTAIGTTFLVTAGMFLAMSIYGAITKRDLTGMGNFLFMGLIGLIIAMIVNIFLRSNLMGFVISCVGVIVFTGLTAYDTQKLRNFGMDAPVGDALAMRRGAILGALTLYLDFINLFIMLLHLFGGNRD